ncbi:MAG TPA: hypothetical protein DCP53_00750 [Elusimicrobia bacterium]|nr:MAG: hypothetical protein A2551_02865 [Elusimicrobia bacterium RIFOXYD2_FULL_34_30]HAM37921.1 hypothetical protein [Elusimicrobiota bacterium]
MKKLQTFATFYIISLIAILFFVFIPLKNKLASESDKSVALAIKYNDVVDLFGRNKFSDFKKAGVNTVVISDEKAKDFFDETGEDRYITIPKEKYLGISSDKIWHVNDLNLYMVFFVQGNLSLLPKNINGVLSVITADDFFGKIPPDSNYTYGILESLKQKQVKKILRSSTEGFRVFRLRWDHDTQKNLYKIKRAVLERNFKIIILDLTQTTIEEALEYIKESKRIIEDTGFTVGKPEPIRNINSIISKYSFFTLIISLFIAIVSPLICLVFVKTDLRFLRQQKYSFSKIAITFLSIIVVSILSGIAISGLLSTKEFMLGVEQFRGIKLALTLPIIITFILLYKYDLKNLLKEPLLIGQFIFFIIILSVLVFYITRSGNSGIMPSIEENFRSFLEKIFFVRPRLKEFLIGHPFMLLSLYLKNLNKNIWKPLFIVGLIGQTSVINTFCHIHSPLYVSLVRTFNGIWIGLILGIILIVIYKKLCLK